jgi:hypothetical protein
MVRKLFPLLAATLFILCVHVQSASAWPVIDYNQFDGTYSTTCSAPTARFNVVVGTATVVDGVPQKVVAAPFSFPMDVTCDDGALEADITAQVERIEELCALNNVSAQVCAQLYQQLDNLHGIVNASLPPVVDSVTFDWHANGFTWLFGVNVTNAVFEFAETPTDPAGSATLALGLIRGNKRIPTAADPTKFKWVIDHDHGIFMNLFQAAPEYAWTPPEALAEYCSGGMIVHTSGDIRVGDDATTVSGVLDVLRSVNCAFPTGDGEYLGISVSTAVEYDFDGDEI